MPGGFGGSLVRMRLQRLGVRNKMEYRMVVAHSKRPRDGQFLEKIGYYCPIPHPVTGLKELRIDTARARHWISVGADPSSRVAWLLAKAGVLPEPPPKATAMTERNQPKPKTVEKNKAKEERIAKREAEDKKKREEALAAAAAKEEAERVARAAAEAAEAEAALVKAAEASKQAAEAEAAQAKAAQVEAEAAQAKAAQIEAEAAQVTTAETSKEAAGDEPKPKSDDKKN